MNNFTFNNQYRPLKKLPYERGMLLYNVFSQHRNIKETIKLWLHAIILSILYFFLLLKDKELVFNCLCVSC